MAQQHYKSPFKKALLQFITEPDPFLAAAAACEEKKQESVGMGWHFRYSGKKMVGSALAVDEKVVHMAFFSIRS